jgi:hypothetical protein
LEDLDVGGRIMLERILERFDGVVWARIQWFSDGAPQDVARCAVNIMKVYFKNEKNPICIKIYYIHDFYFYS